MFRQQCERFGSSVDVSVGEGKAAEYRLKLNTAALTRRESERLGVESAEHRTPKE
jgi:hypothetical protein